MKARKPRRTDNAVVPAPEAEISRLSLVIWSAMFACEKDDFYRPRKGTVVSNIWESGKMTFRQQRAWKKFTEDLYAAAGESGKVTGSYEQAVQVSGNKEWRAWTNSEYDRVHRLFYVHMDKGERVLLRDIVLDEIQSPGVLMLERIGFHINGYKDGAQARAAGIANVCAVLNRIAAFYEF